jgi:DNA repair protein RecN (Recombination protein N)
MLRYLNIANLAVIDALQLEFRHGLNVLSGETGSGKSIIIDALGLLLGERGSVEMIRSGADRAFIEGVFEIDGNDPLIELLSETGIEIEADGLMIRRELGGSGRGKIFINNRSATLSLLKEIQPHLIDIHGQGDHQSLLLPEAHLNLLDAFAGTLSTGTGAGATTGATAGVGATADRVKLSEAYDLLLRLSRELEELRRSESERLRTLDMVNFQVSEIEQANLMAGEDLALEAERKLLANAERLSHLCSEAYGYLYEDESSALARLGSTQKRISELAELDSRFEAQLEQLITAKQILDDAAIILRDYSDEIESSPERLKAVEDRLVELERLKRKYGKNLDEVLATRDELTLRRQSLLGSEEQAEQVERRLRDAFAEYQRAAGVMSEVRRKSASEFERAVKKELGEVALGLARFSICFAEPAVNQLAERLQALAGLYSGPLRGSGKEQVEFFFSANPGEDMKPMNAVASGGELSRLMLVLKTITAPSLFPRTLIFDEIDAGIGGKVADAVGLRLKRLANTNQVLCVTHQSQIARYAEAHFQVSKEVAKGRTTTLVLELDKDGRIEELARMIGGAEVTPLARKHAREMLKTI